VRKEDRKWKEGTRRKEKKMIDGLLVRNIFVTCGKYFLWLLMD
jgi:hypothetical protein